MNLLTLLKRLPFSAGFLSTDVIFSLETYSNGKRSDMMDYILVQLVKKVILALPSRESGDGGTLVLHQCGQTGHRTIFYTIMEE